MISVVIPCYNAEATIVSCVSSVLEQSFTDIEVIVVNDGSHDKSLLLLQQFLAQVNTSIPLKVLSQKNQGVSSARNKGIKHARGEWIAFLDSDDKWLTRKLEIQHNLSQQDPRIDLIGSAYSMLKFPQDVKVQSIFFKKLLFRNYFSTPGVMVKRSLFEKYSFDQQQRYAEDYRLWLLIAATHTCVYINEVLSHPVIDKRQYGESGLSANLWGMEKGELSNYHFLYKEGHINAFEFMSSSAFSLSKYMLRLLKSKKG